ncbi:ribonuclease P protein component [Mesomycoplasma lagogenitalium]|uniref:Ribonuclease P protein component n=1 Tax=Mesomycoplasma lagogenitalium TaxID=171286 RepID=A0ABY8LX10_9BACT|nr:ribonuclease P protein component [Mesomycoplasma lagogenitalium]WGI36657.1 ribonuclease P protein component [Mesomycoplasma lagogenitalium]
MKKENRLKKNWEFQDVINNKKQIVTKSLILYYKSFNIFQIGISVPKKFSNAVKRNYYRRQIKSILNKINYKEIKFQIVLILRKGFLNLSFQEKENEIIKIFRRLGSGEKN